MGGMMQHAADAFTIAAVLTGLASAGCWWWSAHLQAGRTVGWNPAIIERDRKTVRANAIAAILTGLSIALQAFATVLGRLAMRG